MRSVKWFTTGLIPAFAFIIGIGFSRSAQAGIQHYLHIHNETSQEINVQVNGRWVATVYPDSVFQYYVGHEASAVTELYGDTSGYPMNTWEKSVSTAEWDYDWYLD